ncbi:hypothetical protein PR048_028086 [Dryococelus australis]|uniref:PGG domain-containing protein n=1 Tax=Dryococelus australis TaxID=614101 RepID=A0ABQ9GIC3_9NEOP|nr:hypothetical protein PR048_028086 [Dryococelus australis]
MMAESNHPQVTVRDVLAALFSKGAGELHRRHSEGGCVIRINSRVLPRTLPWQWAAADAVEAKSEVVSESHHCPGDGGQEPAKGDLQRDKFWVLCNVLSLGVAFMILSTSFIGTVDLQSSMNANQGIGTISLTSLYVISAISNLCLPSFLIRYKLCLQHTSLH